MYAPIVLQVQVIMKVGSIQPEEFVRLVQPLLERKDVTGLFGLLRSRWSPDQIVELVADPTGHSDARKIALLALGLVGNKCCVEVIANQLKDPDPLVRELAEHALWSTWFRGARVCEANKELARGAEAIGRREFEVALSHLDRAVAMDEQFAEAYNQRAILSYLQENYEASMLDCRRAIELMPVHFGAWAGLGHCLAHLGRLEEATTAYRRALSIHPHVPCIAEAVRELTRATVGHGLN